MTNVKQTICFRFWILISWIFQIDVCKCCCVVYPSVELSSEDVLEQLVVNQPQLQQVILITIITSISVLNVPIIVSKVIILISPAVRGQSEWHDGQKTSIAIVSISVSDRIRGGSQTWISLPSVHQQLIKPPPFFSLCLDTQHHTLCNGKFY